jgi:ATP-dependent RNA helicase DDX23/PRP28
LERLSWCVIDEADKMVSENLSDDLEFILDHGGEQSLFGGKKIVHMFSATMIPEIEQLGRKYLSASYTYITIGEPGGGKKDIDQQVHLIDENSKPDRLTKILKSLMGPLIVFVNSREKC